MKIIALALAAFACLNAASAYAQAQRIEPALPQGVQELRVEPSGELTLPAPAPLPPRLVQNAARSAHDADARHCLAATTNKAIHRCAERYRSRRARAAAVRKTSAKPPAVRVERSAEIVRSPQVVRPGAPNPADAAKAAELVKPMDLTKSGGAPRTTTAPPDAGKAVPAAPAKAPTPPAKAAK